MQDNNIREKCRELATRLYELDGEVYKSVGSSLGRTFTGDREGTIRNLSALMYTKPDGHLLRSEMALISNMARTIKDKDEKSRLMKKYDEILCRIEKAIPDIEIYLMAYFPINYEAATEEMKPCLLIRTNERINEANKAVTELARKHQARYIDINDPLKDADGNLRADYTIEGMHIKEEGYRSIFPMFMKYALEPKWK